MNKGKVLSVMSTTVLFGAVSLLVACNSDSNNSGGGAARPELADVQANYINIAHAVYSDSLSTAENLQAAVNSFVAAPSQELLDAARDAYKATRKPYQQSEIYRWDESITSLEDLSSDGGLESVDAWEGQVNAWPLDETLIETMIASSDVVSEQYLIDNFEKDGNEANVTTGVHAVEFMLWNRDVNARGPGNRSFTEFADLETCNQLSELKCRNSLYLKAATDLLVSDLTAMVAEWNPATSNDPAAKTLAYNYRNSGESLDYMAQSLASMAVGELGGARLSAGLWRPGLLSGDAIKVGDYEEEHDCFSDLSHVAVYYNFQSLMNTFYGSYTKLNGDVVEGASFADYIKAIDPTAFNDLDGVLKAAQTQMKVIFDAGESGGKSFDQIIQDSENYYTDPAVTEKSTELKAVESALDELAKIEAIIIDISEALSLTEVDGDAIGEAD